jgi:UDP-N-acetylmuramoyl-tripeptide--D-alanyl-D-alanine ligase
MLTLGEVLEATGGRLLGRGEPRLPLDGASLDSRRIERGELFAALAGPKHDGHRFVADAFAHGAAAALVSRVPPDCPWAADPTLDGPPLILVADVLGALHRAARAARSRHPARVVGVVGSVATGTARDLIAAVLRARGPLIQSDGALAAEHSLPLGLLRLTEEHRYAVVDLAGRSPAEVRGLAESAQPDVGVVMNVRRRRLDAQTALEEIAAAQAEVVRSLHPDGVAVLNADDRLVRAMAGRAAAPVRFFGLGPAAEVRAHDIAGRGLGGTEFGLYHDGGSLRVVLPLVGLLSVHAALAAATVGLAEGMDLAEVVEALAKSSSSVRIMLARAINGAQILDDTYDAGPESMLAALNLLEELDGRKVAVLGDMLGLGDTEEAAHIKVGSRAALVVDLLVTVGARAALAAAEARRAGLDETAVVAAPDREAAIFELERRLRPGDSVLVKGSREMEMEGVVQAIVVEG